MLICLVLWLTVAPIQTVLASELQASSGTSTRHDQNSVWIFRTLFCINPPGVIYNHPSSWSRCRLQRHAFHEAHACARCHLHVPYVTHQPPTVFTQKVRHLRGEKLPFQRHMVRKLSNDSITRKVLVLFQRLFTVCGYKDDNSCLY